MTKGGRSKHAHNVPGNTQRSTANDENQNKTHTISTVRKRKNITQPTRQFYTLI